MGHISDCTALQEAISSDFAQKNVSSGLAYLSGSPFLCVFSDLKLFPQWLASAWHKLDLQSSGDIHHSLFHCQS